MDFNQAWANERKSGNIYDPQLFATGHAYASSRQRLRKLTPLQQLQNKAAAVAHASNTRAHNSALAKFEQWARQARYGGLRS